MDEKKGESRTRWLTPVRAVILGLLGAVAGGLVGAACGAVLCLADGLPWAVAGWWCLRGVFGGLVAGAVVGAISGIYHVDETTAQPDAVASRKPIRADCNRPAAAPPAVPVRNGRMHKVL